jgi:hypothetical protein
MGARPRNSLVRQIIAKHADPIGVSLEEVFGRNHHARISWVRARVCKELREMGYSLPGIGRALGIDHTSVMHNVRRELPDEAPAVSRSLEYTRNLNRRVEEVRAGAVAAAAVAARKPGKFDHLRLVTDTRSVPFSKRIWTTAPRAVPSEMPPPSKEQLMAGCVQSTVYRRYG